MLDRGRVWRPLDGADRRRAGGAPFGDAARPLVPRYLRRGVTRADAGRRQRPDPARRGAGRARSSRCSKRCDVEGVAICLLNSYVNPAHEQRLRELVHEVLGDDRRLDLVRDLAAGEGVRARVDDGGRRLHEADLHGLRATARRATCAGSASTGELNFADCAATLLPWEEALEQPFRIVFAGPAAGHDLEHAARRARSGTSNLLCADVGGTSTDVSLVVDGRPFVNNTFELEHDLIINALSTEISSVGAGGGSIVVDLAVRRHPVGPGSAGAEPGPACYGRGGTEPTVTDACLLMGILDPEGFAGGEMRARRRARAARVRGARHAARLRAARRPSRTGSRPPTSPRRSPTSRSATASTRATSRSSPTARPGRCCCRRRSSCCTRGASSCPRTRGCSRRSGCSAPTSSTTTAAAPTSCSTPDAAPADRRPSSPRWRTRLRARVGAAARGPAQLRRPAVRPELGDAVRRGPRRADHRRHDRGAGRALPRRVRAALRQPLRVRAGPGRHLPRAADRRSREGRATRRLPESGAAPAGPADRAALLRRRAARRRGEYERGEPAGRRARSRARR